MENIPSTYIADIPLHNLNVQYNDDEIVFIEDLRDLPDFSTCKIAFNVALYCEMGRIQAMIADQTISIHAGQTLVCHSQVVITDVMASPDVECKVVCLTDRILKAILQSQVGIWNRAIYKRHYHVLEVDQDYLSIFQQVLFSAHQTESPFMQEIVISLLRAAFLIICNKFVDNAPSVTLPSGYTNRMEQLFQQFLENIARRSVKKVSVTEYAKELCVTPKYLSTLCHTVSGKSPMMWIAEYVNADISYYLKNTDLSSKEIAHALGFSNPSFFGKYVRQHLGMSPGEYREKARILANETPNEANH